MKKLTLLLVCLIGMISFTSVASPIDKGDKTTLNCSKEYSVVDIINTETKAVNSVIVEKLAYFAGCSNKITFQHEGDSYFKVTCALQSNGTYIKTVQLYDDGGPVAPSTSTNTGTSCSCNSI